MYSVQLAQIRVSNQGFRLKEISITVTSDCSNNIMNATSNYAEKNADMIFFAFDKWSGGDHTINTDGIVSGVPEYSKGLYLFYLQDSNQKYPVYVGYTGRTFRVRFHEHATQESGVIWKYINGRFMGGTTGYTLRVHTADFKPATAMCIEYVFLNTFNFALNRAHNGNTRDYIDRNTPFTKKEDIFQTFREKYEEVIGVTDIKTHFPYFSP